MRKIKSGIATDSVLLIFVRIVTMSVGIIQTMILSRALSKTDYGTYSQGLLIISFFSPFFSLGLENAINYFYNKYSDKDKRQSYVSTIVLISITSGIICALMLILGRNYIGHYFNNPAIIGLSIYISFRPCLQNLVALFQPLFVSTGLAKMIAMRNLIMSLVQIGIVAGVSIFTDRIDLIFLYLLVADVGQFVVLYFTYKKHGFTISIKKIDILAIREILRYSLPLLIGSSFGTISRNLDKLMVSSLMSTEDYALYANMSKELPFSFIASTFTAVVIPHIVKYLNHGEKEKFKNLWANYLEMGYLVTWPLCVGAAFLAPEMIRFLYSSAYLTDAGIAVFIVYTFEVMLRFTYFGMVPSALGKTRIILKYSAIGCVINVLLNYPLFYLMGMIGPAIATVSSSMISAFLYFRSSSCLVNVRVRDVLRVRKMTLLLFEILTVGVAVRFVVEKIEKLYLPNTIVLIFGYGLFVLIIYRVNYKRIKNLMSEMNEG